MKGERSNFLLHYQQQVTLSQNSVDFLASISKNVRLEKGAPLIVAGNLVDHVYFLTEGIVRSFYLKDGTEVNTWFAFENELVGSFDTYLQSQPATETVQALEQCELLAIELQPVKQLSKTNLEISNLVRVMVEEYAAFLQFRINALQFQTAQERYEWLVKNEPQVLKRVSLTHIASYLGVSRETLSRMRAQK